MKPESTILLSTRQAKDWEQPLGIIPEKEILEEVNGDPSDVNVLDKLAELLGGEYISENETIFIPENVLPKDDQGKRVLKLPGPYGGTRKVIAEDGAVKIGTKRFNKLLEAEDLKQN